MTKIDFNTIVETKKTNKQHTANTHAVTQKKKKRSCGLVFKNDVD